MLKTTRTELIFLLSPIFSSPFILKDIYDRKRNSYFLLVLLYSIISYLYIPSATQDKAYYFELYRLFINYDLNNLIIYLSNNKTDIIFYLFIFLFSKLGFSFSFISFIITGITIYLFINVLNKSQVYSNSAKSNCFYFFIMFMLSLSLPDLLSGMRFYLAASFTINGLYSSVIENKNKKGIIYLLLAISTHFSTIVYLPLVIVNLIFMKNNILLKSIFIFSFIFLIIPKAFMFELISHLNLGETYLAKADSYLQGSDFIENSLKVGNFNNQLIIIFSGLWYYMAGIYLLFRINTKNLYINLMMLVYSMNNLVYAVPTIFARYGHISEIIFILFLAHDRAASRYGIILRNIYFVFVIITFLFDIMILKERFYESYFKIEVLTLPTLITYDPISETDQIHHGTVK